MDNTPSVSHLNHHHLGGICPQGHRFGYEIHQTDLVDDGEDGVDEHQVVLLDRQVVGLLQSKQHRADKGDLGGA